MNKTISVVNIHSYISVITNSSTELFVCNTKKKIKAVKEILQKILDGYNVIEDSHYTMDVFDEPWVFSLKKYREWVKKDKELEAECQKSGNWDKRWAHEDRSKYGTIKGWFHDDEDADDMKEMRKHIIEYGERIEMFFGCSTHGKNQYQDRIRNAAHKGGKYDWEAGKEELEKIYNEIDKSGTKPEWWNEPWKHQYCDTLVKDMDGNVIICGSGDNSIPYDIWEFIKSKLNGRNYHLG